MQRLATVGADELADEAVSAWTAEALASRRKMASEIELEMPPMKVPFSLVATALMLAAAALQATPAAAQPVTPLPPAAESKTVLKTQTRSLPARGLFQGDRLSESARRQLADLIVDAIGQEVEVALLVPTGPWKIDESGTGSDERTLTPARLEAVRRFLTERGVDPKKIYVESRTDEKLKEPRLDVQIVSRPVTD